MNQNEGKTPIPWRRLGRYGLVVLIVAGIMGAVYWQVTFNEPKFGAYTPGKPVMNLPFQSISYHHLDSNPFPDGKLWIEVLDAKDRFFVYRYDLEMMEIVGYTSWAPLVTPVVYDERKNLRLFEKRLWNSVADQPGLLEKIGLGRNTQHQDPIEFWLLSGGNQKAVRLGTIHQPPNASTTGITSPRMNYYQLDTLCKEHVMFDLDRAVMSSMPAIQMGLGWWSDEECLIMMPDNGLGLYNARTSQLCNLISFAHINQFVQSHGLAFEADPCLPFRIDSAWTGDHYEFFIAVCLGSKLGWLARIEKPDGKLQLISRNFPYTYTGRLNGAGTHYVFSGETKAEDINAVYVNDIQTSKTVTLVPGSRAEKYYSYPNFYKDKIVFIQQGALRIMDLGGTNNKRLFPAEETGKK